MSSCEFQSVGAVCSPVQESQDPSERTEGLLPQRLGRAEGSAGAESGGALEPRVGGEGGEAVSSSTHHRRSEVVRVRAGPVQTHPPLTASVRPQLIPRVLTTLRAGGRQACV